MLTVSIHPNTKDIDKHWLYIDGFQTRLLQYNNIEALTKNVWCNSLFFNGVKNSKNFISTNLLVLDYDCGYPIDLAKEDFKDFQYVLGITRSHKVYKARRKCDRFRIILQYEDLITDALTAKQNFYSFVMNYNKTVKQKLSNKITAYCQATGQNFKEWQAVDINSSSISMKWIPFKEILEVKTEGKLLKVEPKKTVSFNPKKDNIDLKFNYFNQLGIRTDGHSTTIQCPVCAIQGSDKKGMNLSVRFEQGTYFYRCNRNRDHKIEMRKTA